MASPLKYRASPTANLSVTLPPDLKEALEVYARRCSMSTASIARELLRHGVIHLDETGSNG